MISKLITAIVIFYSVSNVTSYVVTWTGDDERASEVTSRPLLGAQMCTRGPSYWCHNITYAKECHAVHHCISKVWEKMKLPEDNDSVCQVCKDMVQQARDQLLSNETQDELRQVLEGSCNLIPLKVISKECRKLADDFIPELVDTLASRMDPQVVCAVSGLCNSARIDAMLEQQKEPQVPKKFNLKQDSCPKCKYYVGKSVDFLKGMSQEHLVQNLVEVCGRLGSYSDSCSTLVLRYRNGISNHIKHKMIPEEMCALVGLCEGTSIAGTRVALNQPSTAVRVWTPPTSSDDLPCDFCKQMVLHLKDWLVANTTRGEFRDLITGICKNLKKYRKECLNLAQEYGKPLYQLLVDSTNPDEVCGTIGICPRQTGKFQLFSKQLTGPIWTILPADLYDSARFPGMEEQQQEQEQAPMLSLVPAERLAGDDELIVPVQKEGSSSNKIEGKLECQFCEYFLHDLQQYIENPRTEEKIRQAVDKICTRLPAEMNDQCVQFVNSYSDTIINLLAQEVDPSLICPQLGVCPTLDSDVEVPRHIERIDRLPSKPEDIPTCPLCHFAVAKIINMIGANRTKAAIDHALDEVCVVMPRHLKADCINFMTNYGNQIGEMLVLEVTAREVCVGLHLCLLPVEGEAPKKEKIVGESPLPLDRFMPQAILQGELNKVKAQHPELAGQLEEEEEVAGKGNTCVVCEFVIQKLVDRLSDNATEAEIKEEVEHACVYLPKTVQKPCQNFVDTYGDMVIQYLSNSADPRTICTDLELCDQASAITTRKPPVTPAEDKMGKCQLCMVLSDYLSAMLEDPRVDTSIDKIAEKVCPVLPKKYASGCKEMIEDYGPYLMSLLAQATDKGKACSTLNLC